MGTLTRHMGRYHGIAIDSFWDAQQLSEALLAGLQGVTPIDKALAVLGPLLDPRGTADLPGKGRIVMEIPPDF